MRRSFSRPWRSCLLFGCASDPKPVPKVEQAPLAEDAQGWNSGKPRPVPVIVEEDPASGGGTGGGPPPGGPKPLSPQGAPPPPGLDSASLSAMGQLPAPPPSATAGSPPKIGKAELTADECGKVIRKFAELVAGDKGAAMPDDFDQNPMFANVLGPMKEQCVRETTRKQYNCAMAAKTNGAWQTCMK